MRNCGRDLPPKCSRDSPSEMRLRLAIGKVFRIRHRKCGWDSPPEWRRRWPPPRIGEAWPGREDPRQGYRDITGKGKGYAASGSEESYVDLFQHTMSFSHLERSPVKRRWDCSCAVLSLSWIADRIGPPVLQSSHLQSGWESVWNIQNTPSNQEPSKEELGDVTRKDWAMGND